MTILGFNGQWKRSKSQEQMSIEKIQKIPKPGNAIAGEKKLPSSKEESKIKTWTQTSCFTASSKRKWQGIN